MKIRNYFYGFHGLDHVLGVQRYFHRSDHRKLFLATLWVNLGLNLFVKVYFAHLCSFVFFSS